MIPAAVLIFAITQHPAVRAEQLIQRLGGPRYANREQVGQELVKLGRYALPVLRRSQTHKDLEIAERSKRLLPLAEVEAIRQRVAFVLDTPPRPIPADVPLARRFFAVTGDTRAARELYVEMYVAHSKLLEEIAHAGSRGGEKFWGWVETMVRPRGSSLELNRRYLSPSPRQLPRRADLAIFLLLSGDTTYPAIKCPGVRAAHSVFFDPKLAKDHLSGPTAAAIHKLLVAWLNGPRSFADESAEADCVKGAFRLAADGNVSGAREVALRVARDKRAPIYGRMAALLALVRLGRPEDVELMAPLVADNTEVAWGSDGRPGISIRIGDLALAACLTSSGRRPWDFGFPNAGRGHSEPADVFHFGFRDHESRAAARKKWTDLAGKTITTHGRNR